MPWPLPASAAAYAGIDSQSMKGYVEDLAAIARKSRDAGNQFRGRIAAPIAPPTSSTR
jgi:hypothetical protein